MTAADLRWGRGGGRHIPRTAVLAGIDDIVVVVAICPHGHRWHVAERDLNKPCLLDHHRMRLATRAQAADPAPTVIRTVTAAGERCACGSAA